MFDVITFGTATKDIFLRTGESVVVEDDSFITGKGVCFPLGSKIKMDEMYFTSGGGGTNTAVTFAKQNFDVAYCGKIGKDSAGKNVLDDLHHYGVDTRFVSTTDKKPTNHSVILDVPDVDRTIFVYRGASDLYSEKDVFWEDVKANWLYLASFSISSESLFYRLVDHGVSTGAKIMANPSKAQLKNKSINDYLKKTNVLLLNIEEAAIATGTPYNEEEEIIRRAADLAKDVVLVTQGVRGVTLYSDGVFYRSRPVFPNAIDRTGAGDSFGSGFLSEFMRSGDVEKSVQLGVANSTSCLQKKGAKHGLLGVGDVYKEIPVIRGDDPAQLRWDF